MSPMHSRHILALGIGLVAIAPAVAEVKAAAKQSPVTNVRPVPAPVVVVNPPAPTPLKLVPNTHGAWSILRDWDRREIQRFAQWTTNIYEKKTGGTNPQRRAKLTQIFQDEEMNLLLKPGFADNGNDPRKITAAAFSMMNSANACGTYPILHYVYYAAVRGLPVSLTRVDSTGGDIRYSRGNHPVQRFDPVQYGDLASYVRAVCFSEQGNYTTGNWRTAPDMEGTDTVPVAVSAAATVPGLTLLYNPDGHGLMVARVSTTGNVNILDAHPDGSITCGQSLAAVEQVLRGVPEKQRDKWYSGWRMIRFAKAVTDKEGRVTGTRPFTNAEMRPYGYSDEQYTDIISIRNGRPVDIQGVPTRVSSFPEYVRGRLQTVAELDPKHLLIEWANQMHTLFSERATFVDGAWKDVLSNGAIVLPDDKNIYQAEGRWEDWSSPSSDCDRKSAYFLGVEQLEQMVRDFEPGRSRLILTSFGRPIRTKQDLADAIVAEKKKLFDARSITYTSSRGQTVTLTLSAIEQRLFLMSFDPNHPPEVRWGASPDSPEAAGCRRINTPLGTGGSLSLSDSYRREQRLRYRLCRKDGRTWFEDTDNPVAPPKTLIEQRLAPWVPLAQKGRWSQGAGGGRD
jgi:hypothetical protein